MMDFHGKNILVVGMGKSGVAAARLLQREGANVTVTDVRPRKSLGRETYELERSGIRLETGKHREEMFRRYDGIVLSPGVPSTIPPVVEAVRHGIPVIGEVELAFAFLEAPLLGITGSNGKSTTTTLLGDVLETWGKRVFVGGNLGTPLCQHVLSGEKVDWAVVELSSFQLETLRTCRPFVAALLNISPDHLDRYSSLEAYAEAKLRIFDYQRKGDFAVLNADDPWTETALSRIRVSQATPILFSRSKKVDGGVYLEDGWIVSEISAGKKEICRISKMGIQGVHNLENAMAAAAMATICGCPEGMIRESLQKFAGLEHRLEFVRELQGVRYINDSKGTNVGAVIRSLESFEEPVVLIAGGKDKGGDFSLLREQVRQRVKRLILIGEAREKIKAALGDVVETQEAESLKEAIAMAYLATRSGDVVLLSPSCASFDMFKNFEDRGNAFKALVWELPEIAMERLDGHLSAG